MPGIAGHNSRVRIWPHKNPFNQGNQDLVGYVDMMATRWQLTYRTEALDATTFEAPRNPLVTPMMTYVAGITDIEFTIDLLWDTDGVRGNPYGFPDLRPGTRPVIDLFIKKNSNNTVEATGAAVIAGYPQTPGLEGTLNPGEQVFRFVAVIADCTTDSEVRGLVKYTISGNADPEILDEAYADYMAGEYYSTGVWLPSFSNEDGYSGPAFSSQNTFNEDLDNAPPFASTAGEDNNQMDLHAIPLDPDPAPEPPASGQPPVAAGKGAKAVTPSTSVNRLRTSPETGKKVENNNPPTNPTPPAST